MSTMRERERNGDNNRVHCMTNAGREIYFEGSFRVITACGTTVAVF